MLRLESKFTTLFGRWLRYKWPKNRTAHFELKVARGNSLPFNAVSDKQKTNLKIAQKGFYYKYPDMDRLGTPFDCSLIGEAETFVVVQYDYGENKPKNKEFFMCLIDVFLNEEKVSDRKSLTEDRARELCRIETLG